MANLRGDSHPTVSDYSLHGLNYGDEPVYPKLEEIGEEKPAFEAFTEAVENGVRQYLEDKKGYSANVDVNIELTDVYPHEEFFDDKAMYNK